jgi:hypothetical protein
LGGGIADADEWVGATGEAFTNTVLATMQCFNTQTDVIGQLAWLVIALERENSCLYAGQNLECEDENSSGTSDDDVTGGDDHSGVCSGDQPDFDDTVSLNNRVGR